MNRPQTLPSPAKVNLFLKVLRKRDDGYHDIISVMQPVALYDYISIEAWGGDDISISSSSLEIPADNTNLAFMAAELFLKTTGIKRRLAITIEKNIPVAAGLGGGSSNAATVLSGLNDILGAGLSDGKLMDMASALGSDVPFFIMKSPAFASGRGTALKRLKLPHYQYILINPGFHISTAWAYSNLDLTKKAEDNNLIYSEEGLLRGVGIEGCLVNDLETVALTRHPEISRLKRALIEAGASGALMSGSGPTVFGIFHDRDRAEKAFEYLKGSLDNGSSIFMAEGL